MREHLTSSLIVILFIILMSIPFLGMSQSYNCGYFGSITNDNEEQVITFFTEGMTHIVTINPVTCEELTMPIEILKTKMRKHNTKIIMNIIHDDYNNYVYNIKYPTDAFMSLRSQTSLVLADK